jgi:hypothetical protein
MDPVLSWAVCGLSAFLLTAGGYLLSRVAALRQQARAIDTVAKLKAALRAADEARRGLELRRRALETELDQARSQATSVGDGFGEATELPGPTSFFDRNTAPRMQQVSESEFEIAGAAEPSVEEVHGDPEDFFPDRAPQDETRRFQVNSAEAVVYYLQRIDELTEENRGFKKQIGQQGDESKQLKTEATEHVQRLAAMDAGTEKLRQELNRRNVRIRQLEQQLGERGFGGSRPIEPKTAEVTAYDPPEIELLDQATRQVPKVEGHDLLGPPGPKRR